MMKKRDDSESLHLLLSYWYGKIKEKKMVWQGTWKDANTGKVLDLTEFWAPGQVWHSFDNSFSESCFAIQSSSPQPNGARVQNCAGIFEDVNI